MPAIDFELILVVLMFFAGMVWAADAAFFRSKRVLAAGGAEIVLDPPEESAAFGWARSLFFVLLLTVLLRAFVFQPFHLSHDAMSPILLRGDFIFVNKFAYGLRLPVLNNRFIEVGKPKRGDVVLFHYRDGLGTNYMRRVAGLPGDVIEFRNRDLYVNHQLVSVRNDSARRYDEQLGQVQYPPRKRFHRVPDGHYYLIDDTPDSLFGHPLVVIDFVPEDSITGKAGWVFFSWSGSGFPAWSRIGQAIKSGSRN